MCGGNGGHDVANSVTFRFSGGEEFVIDLYQWRDRLRDGVHRAAMQEAEEIATLTLQQLPQRTGNLRRNVKVKDESFGDAVLGRVRSLARHSHLYEKGTTMRRTRRGAERGVMPAHPIFIPRAIQRRAIFKRRVADLMASPEPSLGRGNPTVTGSL